MGSSDKKEKKQSETITDLTVEKKVRNKSKGRVIE
jgi:hypothetical protein